VKFLSFLKVLNLIPLQLIVEKNWEKEIKMITKEKKIITKENRIIFNK
jgi:hypothetical protein